jgi:hypothetical protein
MKRAAACAMVLGLIAGRADSAAAREADSLEAGPLVTFPPNLEARFGELGWRFAASLTWVLGIGPPRAVAGVEGKYRPYSVVLEPGVVLGAKGGGTNPFFRWGLRHRWQVFPTVALGIGAAVSHEYDRNLGLFSAASPETFFLLGRCCSDPGYFLAALRFEYLPGRSEGTLHLGWQF